MIQEIELHGGPIHGKRMTVESSINEIEVVQPELPAFLYVDEKLAPDEPLRTRNTLYTRVFNRGTPTIDFEWVGRIN